MDGLSLAVESARIRVDRSGPALVEVYRRSEEGWDQISLGQGETVELASINFEVSLDELYAGLPAT